MREAAAGGAALVLTPECTNIVSAGRARQRAVLVTEAEDPTLARLAAVAGELGVWLLVGSLCLKSGEADGRFVNRSFLVGPDGGVRARYDKIHMFDVDAGRRRELPRSPPPTGRASRAVVAEAAGVPLGLTICYDLRFPQLYRDLAQAGAEVLTVPSAFTVPTGRGALAGAAPRPGHRDRRLRARAGAVREPRRDVRAARRTYGHSLAVGPWGEVLPTPARAWASASSRSTRARSPSARGMVPSLGHDRAYDLPPGR